ncbi:hypothetical protein [Acinetobacter pittii]|uniref:hypothetical protein n=1 Tax=Acinetobacter pittii TaxID=48296 RepID=UPI00355BB50F
MSEIIIGIDPDLEKSGVAIRSATQLVLKNLAFHEVITLFDTNRDLINKVVIEAGWLNTKSNFRNIQSRQVAERTAKNVGENHATGKLLVQMAESKCIPVLLIKPTRTKLDSANFNRVTGWQGRTNQEQRDACMLIWAMKIKK